MMYLGPEPVISKLELTVVFTVFSNILVKELFRKKKDYFSGVSLIHFLSSHILTLTFRVLLGCKKGLQSIRLPYGH